MATAVDFWVADQLRLAGFKNVVPRRTEPYYVSAIAADLHSAGVIASLDTSLERIENSIRYLEVMGKSANPADAPPILRQVRALRRARASLTANLRRVRERIERPVSAVMGEGRRKQIDVFIADWDRGLELAVSTKTLALGVTKPSDLVKNLPNRWEEFDGDLKNLRGRYPLAAIGALLAVPASTGDSDSILAVADMMWKLTAPGRAWVNAYDAAAIIVVEDWTTGQANDVRVRPDSELPEDIQRGLLVGPFFNQLIDRVLDRSPISEHPAVRKFRADARGEAGDAYIAAAKLADEADNVTGNIDS